MRAPECFDQRQVLPGWRAGRHCRLLEFKLRAWANADRAQQFLLQPQSGLQQRRRAGVLQRTSGQRPVSTAEHAADRHLRARLAVLRQGIRTLRQFLLSRESDDVDRHLLSERPGAERPQQGAMQAADHYPAWAALLQRGSHSDKRRQVLRGRDCDERRAMLSGPGERDGSFALSGANAGNAGLRARLHADAGWQLLQQPFHQRRRHGVRFPRAAVRQG